MLYDPRFHYFAVNGPYNQEGMDIFLGYSSSSAKEQFPYHFRLSVGINKRIFFSFGCEMHLLEWWTHDNIKALCEKHGEPSFYNEIAFLVSIARGTITRASYKTNFTR